LILGCDKGTADVTSERGRDGSEGTCSDRPSRGLGVRSEEGEVDQDAEAGAAGNLCGVKAAASLTNSDR